jgi:hypothetical protein
VEARGELVCEADDLFVFHVESHGYMVPRGRCPVLRG